jgi:hypothetical protein
VDVDVAPSSLMVVSRVVGGRAAPPPRGITRAHGFHGRVPDDLFGWKPGLPLAAACWSPRSPATSCPTDLDHGGATAADLPVLSDLT